VELRDERDDSVGDCPAERTEKLVLVGVEARRVPVSTSLSVCRYDVVEKRSPAGKDNTNLMIARLCLRRSGSSFIYVSSRF
jgi:hypothetical protein